MNSLIETNLRAATNHQGNIGRQQLEQSFQRKIGQVFFMVLCTDEEIRQDHTGSVY